MKNKLRLKVGNHHTFSEVIKWLVGHGYKRTDKKIQPGEFIVNGGNILIYDGLSLNPVNFEFFGNNIEKITYLFSQSGKRKIGSKTISIEPNQLILCDKSKIDLDDYVVHIDHGIGLFGGFVTKIIDGKQEQYITIKYQKGDCLYVPVSFLNKISKYIGIGKRHPKINRLGSKTWEKTYKKTYHNVIKFAQELINIYAKRETTIRPKMNISQEWDREIRKTFRYAETDSQNQAIADTINDLTKNVPLDRLICGDVGFGKTEVAIRAATQTCANGFQVAILVPTTVLCEQHYVTFKKRFKNLPIRISRLSRFISRKHQEQTVKDVTAGKVDILIGTHRIFGKDIIFKNLGLLVIDEEQKFGVKDKEKLKKLKEQLNVLTLTATPIPRTLFMSLSGLRDISQIYTPPANRKKIETMVIKYDDKLVEKAIKKEFSREGQVYYLHNKVRTIEAVKQKLQTMFVTKKIAVAHGQMSESTLAKIMSRFSDGKIDLLVCSTIIENGLDLSNVNTLIVEDSEMFGLSQLYQIRGRIGRSSRQAFALFTYKNKTITDNAFKRFKALVENTELGSGYNIALSDLEIRGGGNILGKEQHGNMEAVGLVLYSKLLSIAVSKLKKTDIKK